MSSVLALAYVGARTTGRRCTHVLTRPWAVLALLATAALLTVLQGLALQARDGLPASGVALASATILLALGVVCAMATIGSPLRLRPSDVAWLLPAPDGPRAVTAWLLLSVTGRVLVLTFLGAALARVHLDAPVATAVVPAVAAASCALWLRSISYGAHLVHVRTGPWAVRVGAAAAVLLAAPDAAIAAGTSVPAAWAAAAAPVTGLVHDLVLAVTSPHLSALAMPWSAVAWSLLLAAVVVTAATGHQERAALNAWQMAAFHSAMRSSGSLEQLVGQRIRAGIPSLRPLRSTGAERAFVWRALAQQRRVLREEVTSVALFFAGTVAAAIWSPDLVIVPVLLLLALGLVGGLGEGLAAELEHQHIKAVPVRPVVALASVMLLPSVRRALATVVVWLPALTVSDLPMSVRLGGLVALPAMAITVVSASTFAAATVSTNGLRLMTSSAVALATVLVVVALTAAPQVQASPAVAVSVVLVVALSVCAASFAIARARVWPQ